MKTRNTFHKSVFVFINVFVFCFLLFATSKKTNAQINPIQAIDSQLRALFSPLWHPVPGPHFLFDMSSHSLDTFYFTDNNPDTINRDIWFKIFEEMRKSAYDTTILPRHDSIFYKGILYQPDSMVMNILAFDYLTFKDSAFSTNDYYDFDTINNTMTDKPGLELNPFNVRRVFAASPTHYQYFYQQMTYRIDPDFIFYDTYNDFNANGWTLQIDFGDGAGWQTFNPNVVTHHTVNYPSTGDIYIRTQVLDMSMQVIMSSIAEANISESSYKKKLPPADEEIEMAWLKAGIYNPCEESGGPMKKILIYLSGYDPTDFLKPYGTRTSEQIYEDMIKLENLSDLRNFGYTIVVVDWKASGRSIIDNAMELTELINELKCRQRTIVGYQDEVPIEEATHEQFVIIGESMGGLVARYAMCFMEQNPNYNQGWCLKEKMHNTRLLITFDSPHSGVNIPLSYQLMYRQIGQFLLGAHSMTQAFTGTLMNVLIDAPSVKQMLLYHVNAYNPVTGACGPAPDKIAFETALSNLGDYPQYCKMMAMGNGSLAGNWQPVEYDPTTERTANDLFLRFNSNSFAQSFGIEYLFMQIDLELRSSPNGSGTLFHMNVQTYKPELRISFVLKKRCPVRWTRLCPFPVPYVPDPRFRVWFVLVPQPLKTENLTVQNMEPYDVIPGSYNGTSLTNNQGDLKFIAKGLFFGFKNPTYNQANNSWETQGGFSVLGFGGTKAASLYTDGLYFSYVPLFSALDYNLGTNYSLDIENESIGNKTSATPFHIISGIPDDARYGVNQNFSHLFVRNDILGSWQNLNYSNNTSNWLYYDDCDENVEIRFLNREIGDDRLIIENRVANWTCIYDALDYVGVNERSPFYEYPSATSSPLRIKGVYSKDDPYVINNGTTIFMATDTPQVTDINVVNLSGSWYKDFIPWVRCCEDYLTFEEMQIPLPGDQMNPENADSYKGLLNEEGDLNDDHEDLASGMLVYPNPTNNKLHIRYTYPHEKGGNRKIILHDAIGKKVMERSASDHGTITLDVSALEKGIYIVSLQIDGVIIDSEKVTLID